MSQPQFDTFFHTATCNSPYAYQCRLACGKEADPGKPETLQTGADCQSQLINIPTGLGKTAAVVLAWLWNRVVIPSLNSQLSTSNSPEWPRRLVYCLPMRTLVEQTEAEVAKWLFNLRNAWAADKLELSSSAARELLWLTGTDIQDDPVPSEAFILHPSSLSLFHSPVILMGGEDAGEWDIHPEKPAILIGTQDMLLSRALNRGYGMSRYRWPMHFGLLNNDCLWVMDETQLMGVGVETSAQLDGFRKVWPTFKQCPTWWMSATLDESRLDTVDHFNPENGWLRQELSKTEQSSGRPKDLFHAPKRISRCPISLSAENKAADYAKQLAALIKERHQNNTLTLVILNRVSRAREVFEVLAGGKKPLCDPAKVSLIHSRFRRPDRQRHEKLLFGQGDRIVIATQAVEAGVDVSARLLVTELAPWSSLVQRTGRCNRRADIPDAEVVWVNIEPDTKEELVLPYTKDELDEARKAISELADASPHALREVQVESKSVIRPVIRRRDLMDLFDTTPDLCGQDLDISRYIRDGEDSDVQFFWRNIASDTPSQNEPPPHRDELCRVSIGEASKFLGKKAHVWRWNPLAEGWEEAKAARPGGVYLVDAQSGGYNADLGWTGDPKDKPTPHRPEENTQESYSGDTLTFARDWQLIAGHTRSVLEQTDSLSVSLSFDASFAFALRSAALWHDAGKAHKVFQIALRNGPCPPPDPLAVYAKSKNPPKPGSFPSERRGFRHELASALAWLLAGPADAVERDLTAYLVAAHHGKVRLSIRSLPDEKGNPEHPEALFARGIWDGDTLLPIPGLTTGPTVLDLGFMQMGEGRHGPSWLARTVALRDRFGPFHLAFLETILRAADAHASKDPAPVSPPASSVSGMELHESSPPHGGSTALSPEEQSLVADLVADGLGIQNKFRPEPLYKQIGKGHYEGGTVEEIRRAR